MTSRTRLLVAGLILLGILGIVAVVAFAGSACPVETEAQPCPDATRNVVTVITLASLTAASLVTPFAFLGEVMARRRIVYRGAWWRAGRRGALVGLVIAALAGLRLGGALSVPIAIFVVILAAALEWFLARRDP
jgi:hypothetical protein